MMFDLHTKYFDDIHSLAAAVKEHSEGRTYIAAGGYAEVRDAGPNLVVKISGGDDLGYLAYLKVMARLGEDNPYLPRIQSSTHFRLTDEARKGQTFYQNFEHVVTYMERLEGGKKYRGLYDERGVRRKNVQESPLQKFNRKLVEFTAGGRSSQVWMLRPVHQDLVMMLRIALEEHRLVSPDEGRLDMHAGNTMVRGHRFVVTDPLSG